MPSRDLVLNDGTSSLPLQVYADAQRPKGFHTTWEPVSSELAEHTWRDTKNGYGYSQPGVADDGYAYCTNPAADYGPGLDARSPGVVIPAGAITEVDLTGLVNIEKISDSFSLGGDYYFLAGRTMVKVLSGYSTLSTVGDAGPGERFITAAVARYSGTSYAWIGKTNGFSKWDGTTLTTTTSFVRDRVTTVYWATTDGVSVQRLVSDDTSTTIKHCPLTSDPMNGANWSAQITVGEGAYFVNSLVSTGRHVYISTTGGVYDLDDLGQTVNLNPYSINQYSDYNGLITSYWDGSVLYGTGTGIDAVDITQPGVRQAQANWAMPGAVVGIPNETPIYGRPAGFSNDGGWVVASIYNGTDSYIVYGKKRYRLGFPGPGEWVWHGAFAVFRNQLANHLAVRTVTQGGVVSRRLWIATTTSDTGTTARLFYQSLPLTTTARQDAINATAHRFGTGGQLYHTPTNFNAPGKQATLIRGTYESRALDATHTLVLAVATDDTTFGAAVATSSASTVDTFPLSSSGVIGAQVAPRTTFTGTATAPPVLRSLTLQASVDPLANQVYEFDAWFQREQTLTSGAVNHHASPESDYVILASMRGKVATLLDPMGNETVVVIDHVLPGTIGEIEESRDGTRGWGRRVTVRARVVDIPARYGDETALYDLESYYG